ncbi:AAA family ATPase [Kitasatospora sp. NPDC049285]|uniref:helix-turn-helix transcriptional regulator n=1 Tax=Kitasatospora sp. NPDC049285 TaxID=3157096 RepID=UPI00341A9C78
MRLYGRGREQAAIGRLLAGAREGTSGVLVLRGDPGIGKTALLDDALARADGFRVLRASGVESEASLSFAALTQLLAAALDRVSALPGPQRAALERVLGLADGPAGGGDRLLVGLAVLTLLGDLAEERPLLCVVDDLQWVDHGSVQALQLAARRLGAERVVLLLATRPDGPDLPGLPELRLDPLDPAEAAALLTAIAPELPSPERVLAEAQGNPLALVELPQSGPAAPGTAALPMVGRLRVAYHGQVSRLPAGTQRWLLLAALEETGALDVLLPAAAASWGLTAVELAPAEAGGLVHVDLSAGLLTFRHPLLRSALVDRAPLAERLAAHAALADALGPQAPLRRAWHRALAATGRDTAVAEELAAAASSSASRGGHAGASAAYERAARLSQDPSRERELTVAAVEAALEAGELGRAEELSATAMAGPAPDDLTRAHLLFARGIAEFWRGDYRSSFQRLTQAADLVATTAPGPAARVLVQAIHAAWYDDATSVHQALTALRTLPLPPTDPATPLVHYLTRSLAHLTPNPAIAAGAGAGAGAGNSASAAGTPAESADAGTHQPPSGPAAAHPADTAGGAQPAPTPAEPAPLRPVPARPAETTGRAPVPSLPFKPAAGDVSLTTAERAARAAGAAVPVDLVLPCGVGLVPGHDDEVLDLARRLVREARETGAFGTLPTLLFFLAEAELFDGRPESATAQAAEALQLALDSDQSLWAGQLHGFLAYAAATRGAEEDCREHARAALAGGNSGAPWSRWALGVLELGAGRAEDALAQLDALARSPQHFHVSAVRSVPDLVEAAVRLRRPEQTAEPLARFERWAEHSGRPWARALVHRCHALLAPDELAEGLYRSALDLHAEQPRPWELARTRLLYGEWLRRGRRKAEARGPLRAADQAFRQLGAEPWSLRARTELDATGAAPAADRPAAPDTLSGLTPQENQIVRLAARGLSNRDIAAQLFLSARTVGYHLYKAYPKLGVTSRTELSELVPEGS